MNKHPLYLLGGVLCILCVCSYLSGVPSTQNESPKLLPKPQTTPHPRPRPRRPTRISAGARFPPHPVRANP